MGMAHQQQPGTHQPLMHLYLAAGQWLQTAASLLQLLASQWLLTAASLPQPTPRQVALLHQAPSM